MDRLVIDLDQIASLQSQLSQITNTLENDVSFSAAISDYVGHEELARGLRSFATNWNVHRKGIVEDLKTVNRWVGEINHTFRDLESHLSSGVSSDGAAQGNTSTPSGSQNSQIA